jgi:flagellar assembly protein FliH
MNTWYSKPGMLPSSEVEMFPYRDTLGGAVAGISADGGQPPSSAPIAENESARGTDREDISRLLTGARAEGVAEGTRLTEARLREDLVRERERIAVALRDFQVQRADYYSKVESELVQLALAITRKILHRESQIDPMVVAGLVKVMLERLNQNTNVTVRVRPQDAESWRRELSAHAGLQVIEDATLQPNDCVLETDLGVANMGLEAQLKEVEQGFFDLLARRPEAK